MLHTALRKQSDTPTVVGGEDVLPKLRTILKRMETFSEGLRSGAVDTIHSDHDPQDTEVERQPFAEASDGAIGLETLLAAALRLVHSGDVELLTVMRAMTSRPAEILGLPAGRIAPGAPADLILVDLDYPWQVSETQIRSRSRNTSFQGHAHHCRRRNGLRARGLILHPLPFTGEDTTRSVVERGAPGADPWPVHPVGPPSWALRPPPRPGGGPFELSSQGLLT